MKAEKILVTIVALGVAMKFFAIPFSGPILVLSLMGLTLVYFPGGFHFLKNSTDENSLPVWVRLVLGFFLCTAAMGALFKLMYWPGAQANLAVAAIALSVFFALSFYKKSNDPDPAIQKAYAGNLMRTLLWLIVSVTLYLTPLQTQIQIENWRDPELARLKYNSISNPADTAAREAWLDYERYGRD